jgi:hypothetical protein
MSSKKHNRIYQGLLGSKSMKLQRLLIGRMVRKGGAWRQRPTHCSN